MTFVSLVKNSDPSKAVNDAIQLVGGLNVKGTVLIKPNLSCARPSGSGLVTNVDVLTAIVKMVADQGARPLVGDLPIVGWDANKVFDATGVRAIEEAGGELVDWRNNNIEIELPNARVLKKVEIARTAIEVDAIINVPVLKHHYLTHLSGGLKNLFGLVEPNFRPKVHVLGLDNGVFWSALSNSVDFWDDFGVALLKSAVFGGICALVAAYEGFHAEPTIEGTALATTRAVVNASLLVLMFNFVLSALLFRS